MDTDQSMIHVPSYLRARVEQVRSPVAQLSGVFPLRPQGLPARRAVETDRAGAEVGDVEQASHQHDVLEEVDHLVLIRKIVVEENRCRQREQGHQGGNQARAVSQ